VGLGLDLVEYLIRIDCFECDKMADEEESKVVPEYSDNLRRICSQTLDLPPSCMEFLPLDNSLDGADDNSYEYFVVGTYHLQTNSVEESATEKEEEGDGDEDTVFRQPKPQERDGSLNLFRIQDENL
jgi:diphthamide biosynthesis protein 7